MHLIEQARAFLAAINPALPAVALVLVLWAPQAAIRRWLPSLWAVPASWGPKAQELRRVWQALPSLAGGALLGAVSSGGDPWQAAWGSVVAAATPFLHHALKAAPIPYTGELGSKRAKDDDDDLPRGGKMAGLALAFVVCLSCSPAQWQAQRDAASVVSEVANGPVIEILERAYRADGLVSIERARDANDAQLYYIEWKARWLPVWAAWEVFREAHAAWLAALNTEGDPLATGEAMRNAFCLLKSNALKAGARIPDMPLFGCEP
jgi:uncharacterized phage-associated protein